MDASVKINHNNKFFIGIVIYIIVWILSTVVACIKLWDVLSNYQQDYDVAKAAAEPDLAASRFIEVFDENHLANTLKESGIEIESEFYNENDVAKALLQNFNGDLSYKRVENYNDKKPIYNIYVGNNAIGTMQLKASNQSDQFGFRGWDLGVCNVNVESLSINDLYITVPEKCEVTVNGIKVEKKYLEEIQEKDTLNQMAFEMTGISHKDQKYHLTGILNNLPIKVITEKGEDIVPVNSEENNVSYIIPTSEEFIASVDELVNKVSEAYILNANNELSFQNLSQYIENGSEAYQAISSVQSGLAWAGKSDVIRIEESNAYDYKRYGEDVFTVKTYNKLYREYRNKTYEDEFRYEWLLVKVNGSFKVRAFLLI